MFWYGILFNGGMSSQFYELTASNAIKYLLKNMPDVLEEFVGDVNDAYKSGIIHSIVTSSLNLRYSYLKNIYEKISRNVKRFDKYYSTLKNENTEDFARL